jgi:hypothetical protein
MLQYLVDDLLILDTGNHLGFTFAFRTDRHVDVEHPLQALRLYALGYRSWPYAVALVFCHLAIEMDCPFLAGRIFPEDVIERRFSDIAGLVT